MAKSPQNQLYSSSIPNFVNGVSQQPFTLRLSTQGDAQENGLSTVSQGLKKRPPTQHLKKVSSTPLGDCFIHTINRDPTERYVVVVTNGDLKVYDIAGNAMTVAFPDGKGYLTSTSASTKFAAVTVADYTFIVNKDVAVTQSTAVVPLRPYEALINVKAGNYGKTYKVIINGATVASYTTANGTSGSDVATISTDHIATQLYNGLVNSTQGSADLTWSSANIYTLPTGVTQTSFIRAETSTVDAESNTVWTSQEVTWLSATTFSFLSNPTETAGIRVVSTSGTSNPWNAVLHGSTIYIHSTTDFSIATEDGFNNGGMVAIKGALSKFADLPPDPRVDGFVVEITGTGDSSSTFDNYYVRFDASGASGVGVWKECPKPGIRLGFTASTAPHILVRESNGTFTFKNASWDNRIVGDLESNGDVSFIGRTISDIFFYRNRLGLIADESVIFSESGKYFNFWRTTVTDLLDSDPIDVTASHTKVSLLKHAIPFNKQLLLFSEQTQFIVDQNDLLTPKTVGLKVATEFPCSVLAKPIGVGKNVYFSVDKGSFSAFREYFADFNNISNDSIDITGHIPQYIPSQIYRITSAPNEDILVAATLRERNALYVYKYFWANNEKLQSSWSKWTFPTTDTILNVEFIASDLFFIINRADGVYFEKMTVSLGDIGTGEPFNVHLDRKVQLTSSALSYAAGYTTINTANIGYTPENGTGLYQAVVKDTVGTIKAGEVLEVEVIAGVPKIKGNYAACSLTFGRKYTLSYALSTITIKQAQAGGGQKSDTEGRLQLRKIAFNYANSGYFRIEVTPSGRETYSYVFSGKVLGATSATIGRYNISNGRFIAPVVSRNIGTSIVIKNDSPLPSSFLSADWEGLYVKRSQSV